MMVDTSAVIAILNREPEAELFTRQLLTHPGSQFPAANYPEAAIVLDNHSNPLLSRQLDEMLSHSGINVVGVTPEQARIARSAHRDFGRGSGSPAGLNFGDCFAYALAIERDEPLLYKGDDFVHTDVGSALADGLG